jgi:hypothetical protein
VQAGGERQSAEREHLLVEMGADYRQSRAVCGCAQGGGSR